jgi:hypothetical protein
MHHKLRIMPSQGDLPMRPFVTMLIAALAAIMLAHPANAAVSVNFVNPQNYSDLRSESASQRDEILDELRQTMVELGTRYLKPGQSLNIEVLDVQRAGLFRDTTSSHTALLTANTPPRIDVQYTLRQNGKIVRSSHEAITDIDYFLDQSSHLSSDRLVYEKQVLRDWFRQRFGVPK